MKCPNCGNEMETGVLRTDKYPCWTQQKELPIFRKPKDLVTLRPVDDEAVSLLTRDPFPEYPEAMLCRGCGLAAFPCKVMKE